MKGPRVTRLPAAEDVRLMLSDVLLTIDGRRQRKTRLHRIVAFGTIGILALGTTAGAIVVTQATSAQMNMVDCYRSPDLNSEYFSSVYLPANEATEVVTPVDDRTALAVDMCAAGWRIGTFETEPAERQPGQTFSIPELVACELRDSRIAVFPSEQPAEEQCHSLGLAVPD